MVNRPRGRGILLVASALLVLSGCGGPGDDAAYREVSSTAVAGVQSGAATAQLAIQHWVNGDLTSAAAEVIVGDADSSLAGIDTKLRAVDPPVPQSDRERARVVPLVDRTREAVAAGRIALSRNDKQGASKAVEQLDGLLDQLDSVAVSLR